MRTLGLESLFPMSDLSVMGIGEIIPSLFKIRVRVEVQRCGFCFMASEFILNLFALIGPLTETDQGDNRGDKTY